jgi:1,4-alpha-glucan branching enzyme
MHSRLWRVLKQVLFYCSYCNQHVDKDAFLYLILANELLHTLHPDIITIAEDVGNYGLCCSLL